MRTDKQLFKVFEAVPEWLFELAGIPSPGKSKLCSFTAKALQRVADGVVVPDAADQPLTVVEFQFQKDDTIYTRTVVEMAAWFKNGDWLRAKRTRNLVQDASWRGACPRF